MLKIFKRKISIPKENAQEVETIDSYTVSWDIKTGWSGTIRTLNKVFINRSDAKEFKKQLIESANFIDAYIETRLIIN